MIIGISGKAQSGKDFTATLFQYHLDENSSKMSLDEFRAYITGDGFHGPKLDPDFEIRRFADKLKKCASVILNVSVHKYEEIYFKQSPIGGIYGNMTYREFLNKLADCTINRIHPDIWMNALLSEYSDGMNWIIPDVRFKNKFNWLTERKLEGGHITIRIKSENHLNHNHYSETNMDDVLDSEFDFVIENSEKDFNKLNSQVIEIVKKIKSV